MKRGGLHFLPLGGTGEIGMNLNAYHHQGQWLVVDCGVMFARRGPHRTDVLFPDISFLAERADAVMGLVLTHIHQDHLGAVADLWPQLRCPVYCTRFAAEFLKPALAEHGLGRRVPIKVIEETARFKVGPFDLQRIPLTHSTVEMGAFVLRTPAGKVLHTGDWKLDPDPLVGLRSDEVALDALHDETIHACISDSTNAHLEGWTPSESDIVAPLVKLVGQQPHRVAVTLFSSNVARLDTLARVAHETGRQLVLVGRSLLRTVESARAAGYLQKLPPIVPPHHFGFIPRRSVLMVCTGSQGEPRAALTRIAEDSRTDMYLEHGDTVIYSARRIPGCELPIDRVQHMLRERGVRIIESTDANVHVSGHPRRDELRDLYTRVRPQNIIPVHGTPMHLDAHVELAESMGIAGLRINNGDIVQIGPKPRIVGTAPVGRLVRREPDRPYRPKKGRKPWSRRRFR
jgi:ribonuclease J